MPPASTPRLLRRLNAGVVLDTLRDGGPMRVTELIDRTGLSRPTVDAVADDLLRLGWLEELDDDAEAAGKRRRGRPARRLAFRADAGHVLGLDIGEAKVRAAVADLGGEILGEELRSFEPAGDRLALVRRTASSALKSARVERSSLLAVGAGCTGGMDPETGEVLYSSGLPPGTKLAAALLRSLGAPVAVENDCNLAVIGERWRGIAAGVDDVICVLASERMGAGIVVGGRLVRGHRGAAGEMGVLGAHAQEHGAEGIALLARRMGADAVASGDAGILRRLAGGDAARVEAELVFAAAGEGDVAAARIVDDVLHRAGRAIVPLAQVLNPELIVISGGVATAGEQLVAPLRRQVEELSWLPPRVEASSLAERGVVVGAIRHALDHLEPRLLDGLDEAA
jgi:predicted NBD/HSP70 family sugar kinase